MNARAPLGIFDDLARIFDAASPLRHAVTAEETVTVARMLAYTEALKRFDWQYDFSDSLAAWRNGRDQLARLHAEQQAIDPTGEVWMSIRPDQHGNALPKVAR